MVELRSGAGSIPAACRISQTVEAATFTPSTSNSSFTRRYPTRDSRGPAATPGRESSARCAAGPGRAPGPGPPSVLTRDHIAVPAEHGIRAHHQVQSEHVPRDLVQQCRQQRLISLGEPDPVWTELPLQDRELVAQREDLRVFFPAAHRKQPQQCEHVHNTEIGQLQQHGRSPCHSVPLSHKRSTGLHRVQHRPDPYIRSNQHGRVFRQEQRSRGAEPATPHPSTEQHDQQPEHGTDDQINEGEDHPR